IAIRKAGENARPDSMLSEMPDLVVSFARESFDPRSHHPDEYQPDIIIIHIEGQETCSIRSIKAHYPESQIIVVSNTIDRTTALKAYRDGATNYVQKSTCQRFLHYAILSTLTAASIGNSGLYPQFTKYQKN